MSFSLYDATVPAFLQFVAATSGVIAKAEAHCVEQSIDIAEMVAARLAPDMLPFSFQAACVVAHSIGAIEGARAGEFGPPRGPLPESMDAIKAQLADAHARLQKLTPEAVNAFVGKPVQFKLPSFTLDFTAENFLMSFSLPNFYFHASTAYDILRHKGVALSKRDFLGQLRMNG